MLAKVGLRRRRHLLPLTLTLVRRRPLLLMRVRGCAVGIRRLLRRLLLLVLRVVRSSKRLPRRIACSLHLGSIGLMLVELLIVCRCVRVYSLALTCSGALHQSTILFRRARRSGGSRGGPRSRRVWRGVRLLGHSL